MLDFVVNAAWFQPIPNFPALKAMGINTLMGMDLEGDPAKRGAWIAAAGINGFKMILDPVRGGVPSANEDANPNVIGHLILPDEPNGVGAREPGDMLGVYSYWKRLVGKPLYLSLDGPAMIWKRPVGDYMTYVSSCDVVAEDVYPANNGMTLADKALRIDLLKATAAAVGNRKVMTVLEAGNQELSWRGASARGPGPGEIAAQVDMALARGVDQFCWFVARDASSPHGYASMNLTADQQAAVKLASSKILTRAVAVPASRMPPINATITAPGYRPAVTALEPL